jgi:hypothetical protein
MGGAYRPRCMDPGFTSAHHHNVRAGIDADALLEATPGEAFAAELLRRKRIAVVKGTDSAGLHRWGLERKRPAATPLN